MRKAFILLICLILMIPSVVHAGDAHMEIMSGKQDALIIGKITDFKNDRFLVYVEKLLMGEVDGTTVTVEDFQYYGIGKPAIGDFCVLPLNKKDGYYQMVNMAFKADRADYKTLKIENPRNFVFQGPIQSFINSGRFVEADKMARERKQQTTNPANSPTPTAAPEPKQEEKAVDNNRYPLVITLLSISCIGIILWNRHRKKKR